MYVGEIYIVGNHFIHFDYLAEYIKPNEKISSKCFFFHSRTPSTYKIFSVITYDISSQMMEDNVGRPSCVSICTILLDHSQLSINEMDCGIAGLLVATGGPKH